MSQPIVVAAGAVVRRGSQILLIQRGQDPVQDRWSVPGGRVEPGERLVDAARREVREEVGIDIEVGALVGVVERKGPGYHVIVADFLGVCPPDAEPVAGDDAADVAWVDHDELERWDLVEGLRQFFVDHGII